jgi:nephrocystin-3
MVRVFVCSTFRDFADERDLLMKRVFPELRRRARERFVEVIGVDLRWGITEEESERGETLPICLREIERSRPHFIGLVGERYGWTPPADRYPEQLLAKQPWLAEHAGATSVTELEILHGVLNHPGPASRARFYFRDPRWSEGRGDQFRSESDERRRRLAQLKQRIRASGCPVTEYSDPGDAAERITEDLWRLIDADFPASDVPEELERERRSHAAYAAERQRLFVGQESAMSSFLSMLEAAGDGAIESDKESRLLAITGESGTGKSALIANSLARYRARHSTHIVIEHYVGSASQASNPDRMMDRIDAEIRHIGGSTGNVSAGSHSRAERFADALAHASLLASSRGIRFVIAIDGIDRLLQGEHLNWLPRSVPPFVRIVMSTPGGQTLEALLRRNPRMVRAQPFTSETVAEYVTEALARRGRRLSGTELQRIACHPNASVPLHLRALVDEISVHGSHDDLHQRIAEVLSAETTPGLFGKILARIEADMGAQSVRVPLQGILLSPDGMTEEELRDFAAMAPIELARLLLALGDAVYEADGLIRLSHDHIRQAVADRYASSAEATARLRAALGSWWIARGKDSRCVANADYHLCLAERWEDLVRLHVDPQTGIPLLGALDCHERMLSWERAARGLGNLELPRFVQDRFAESWDAWQDAMEGDPAEATSWLSAWLELFDILGAHGETALRAAHRQLDLARGTGEMNDADRHEAVGRSIDQLITLHRARNELGLEKECALELLEHSRKRVQQDDSEWAAKLHSSALSRMSEVHERFDEIDDAVETQRQCDRITRRLISNRPSELARQLHLWNLSRLTGLLRKQGELDAARQAAAECVALARNDCEANPSPERLRALTIGLIAAGDVARELDELEEAIRNYVEAMRRRNALVTAAPIPRNLRELSVSFDRVALVHELRQEFQQAARMYRKGLDIARMVADMAPSVEHLRDVAISHVSLGRISRARGSVRDALRSYVEALSIMVSVRRAAGRMLPAWTSERDDWLSAAMQLAIDSGNLTQGVSLARDHEECCKTASIEELGLVCFTRRIEILWRRLHCEMGIQHPDAERTAEALAEMAEMLSSWLAGPVCFDHRPADLAWARQAGADGISELARHSEAKGDADFAAYARQFEAQLRETAKLDRQSDSGRKWLVALSETLRLEGKPGVSEDAEAVRVFVEGAMELLANEERRGDGQSAWSVWDVAVSTVHEAIAGWESADGRHSIRKLLDYGLAMAMRLERFDRASAIGRALVDVARSLIHEKPDSFGRLELSRLLIRVSDAEIACNRPAVAVGVCEEAVAIRRDIAGANNGWRPARDLAVALSRLAGAREVADDDQSAARDYRESLQIMRAGGAPHLDSSVETFEYSVVLERLALLEARSGEALSARQKMLDVTAIRQPLMEGGECTDAWRRTYVRGLGELAAIEHALGNLDAAAALYEQSADRAARLFEATGLVADARAMVHAAASAAELLLAGHAAGAAVKLDAALDSAEALESRDEADDLEIVRRYWEVRTAALDAMAWRQEADESRERLAAATARLQDLARRESD